MSATIRIESAIKKLERAGYAVEWEKPASWLTGTAAAVPTRLRARANGRVIECIRNGHGDTLATIRVRRENDHDDMQSDYFAGSFFDTITAAIRYAARP